MSVAEAGGVSTQDVHVSTVEGLLFELWSQRTSPEAVDRCCEALIQAAPSELDRVEMYLPQFAHMVIVLGDDVASVSSIERFILAACQLSLHVALHYWWMVYSVFQENRPKITHGRRTSNVVYERCRTLQSRLEQCVAYGRSNSMVDASLSELMSQCAAVARQTQARQPDEASASSEGKEMSGHLYKKGGGQSRFGRTTWNKRYFLLKDDERVLYYYAQEANATDTSETAPFGRPMGSMALTDAKAKHDEYKEGKYKHTFTVFCEQTELKFTLRAESEEKSKEWVHRINSASKALPKPLSSKGSLRDLHAEVSASMAEKPTPRNEALLAESLRLTSEKLDEKLMSSSEDLDRASIQKARLLYEYFQDQRLFVKNMTKVAEELRHHSPDERQELLHSKLTRKEVRPRPFSYFPLVRSDEPCCTLLRFTPYESIVFNTKARCPLMIICEVQQEDFKIRDIAGNVMKVGSSGTAGDAAPEGSAEEEAPWPHAYSPTYHEKKREKWMDKAARIKAARVGGTSALAPSSRWSVRSFIVKSNDDLRQEVFIMQMIGFFKTIWPAEAVWLNAYHIVATGPDTGLIETITGSADLDALKRRPGYGSLRQLFIERYGEPGTPAFLEAQANFARSLAGYSVVMWILELRDRHNGNLMLTEDGHYFHIDFGFCLGHSTGKQIGGMVECSPFKLTEECIELLDGRGSAVYERFCDACVKAMVASHAHAQTICTMVEILGARSKFPCFKQTHVSKVIPALERRLFKHLKADQVEAAFRRIIKKTAGHWGSRWYDYFQNLQQGIAI